jgi:mRNA interferase RelE/StbE
LRYQVEYSEGLDNDLKKLDKHSLSFIKKWIDDNLVGCRNPRRSGKALTGVHSGKWSYRVADYRIIAKIYDGRLIILVVTIGHRKNVYK